MVKRLYTELDLPWVFLTMLLMKIMETVKEYINLIQPTLCSTDLNMNLKESYRMHSIILHLIISKPIEINHQKWWATVPRVKEIRDCICK